MIAWLVYGSLEQRTGGTIYDRLVIEGLRERGAAIDVIDPARLGAAATVRRLASTRLVIGDELCFRELAFVFPRLAGARRVLLVHHLTCWEEERSPRERLRARAGEARALRAASAVVTTSQATRARLEREGAPERRIEVVRPGSDRLPVAGPAARGSATRFLFLGAVTARKRVRELVKALPPGAELRVVGSITRDGGYADAVRALGGAVTFLGEVDDPTVALELAAVDALVMPSSLEGYGIAATEAIAAGLPVIAARTPGLEEALAPCPDAALFVNAGPDSSALASALHRFSTDATLRARMRAAAATATLPSWADTVTRFASIIGS
ncbi:MAG: glycosyltransferase family 4 protein [Labilithrix sp.]